MPRAECDARLGMEPAHSPPLRTPCATYRAGTLQNRGMSAPDLPCVVFSYSESGYPIPKAVSCAKYTGTGATHIWKNRQTFGGYAPDFWRPLTIGNSAVFHVLYAKTRDFSARFLAFSALRLFMGNLKTVAISTNYNFFQEVAFQLHIK